MTHSPNLNRREFLTYTALGAVAGSTLRARADTLTAQDVLARIKQNIGVPWAQETVDTFKDGDPTTPVTGVAVTMMATFDVVRRAAAQGANLVITPEPTFYDHFDKLDVLEGEKDAVTAAKRAFIREHRMVVLRMHDHWHRRRPEPTVQSLSRVLGWEQYWRAETEILFRIPETTVAQLGATIRQRLRAPTLRAVGSPGLRVTSVAIVPGAAPFPMHRQALRLDGAQVLVIGEAREWETVEYVVDAITAGQKKALIIIGHIPSEQVGMEEFARWLGTFVKEVPISFVPAADPFWSPK
ncbi:MAG TPA: Nif3-like dinuclear metal center hexameric protein [Gemmatimonadales bacterium]|nr:Nif3-like dinuclear metal center hexameric protein [Gemmatimonadales bacterium]